MSGLKRSTSVSNNAVSQIMRNSRAPSAKNGWSAGPKESCTTRTFGSCALVCVEARTTRSASPYEGDVAWGACGNHSCVGAGCKCSKYSREAHQSTRVGPAGTMCNASRGSGRTAGCVCDHASSSAFAAAHAPSELQCVPQRQYNAARAGSSCLSSSKGGSNSICATPRSANSCV